MTPSHPVTHLFHSCLYRLISLRTRNNWRQVGGRPPYAQHTIVNQIWFALVVCTLEVQYLVRTNHIWFFEANLTQATQQTTPLSQIYSSMEIGMELHGVNGRMHCRNTELLSRVACLRSAPVRPAPGRHAHAPMPA